MTPERWERIKAVFQAALERPAAERGLFVAGACGGDVDLQREVERLLRSHEEAGSFIEAPAAEALASGVGNEAPHTATLARGEASRSAGPVAFAVDDLVAGRYRIVRFIARGGMGEVYEVEDLTLKGRLALKTIRPDVAADEKNVARFRREIQLARSITHPNVCRIHGLGFHDQATASQAKPATRILFLTMELLAGETLLDRIRQRGRFSTGEALPIVQQLAAGLDAAHGLGIVHRDFKSGNVMLEPAGHGARAVITDFGLARGFAGQDAAASISETGGVVGTPAYMAPEQVRGLPLTAAADIYAFGVVLYEMLSGRHPFEGESAMSLAVRRLTEDPTPLRTYAAGIDATWEAAVMRCLERDPAARFRTAGEAIEAIGSGRLFAPVATEPVGPVSPPPATISTPTKPGAVRTWPMVALAGLLAGGAGYWGWRGLPPQPPAKIADAAQSIAARPSLVVLGFRNNTGRSDAAWLQQALPELVAADLAASGKLRLPDGDAATRMLRDLGLADGSDPGREALQHIVRDFGIGRVVTGAYATAGNDLSLDLKLVDAATGSTLSTGEGSGPMAQIVDIVSQAGAPIRQHLGIFAVPAAQAISLRASFPTGSAAPHYAEGLFKLRSQDLSGAREAFEKAAAADPRHPMPQAMLATVWAGLGYEAKAREAARRASSLAASLPPQMKLLVEARLHESTQDWVKAAQSYASLFGLYPDDVDLGVQLANAQIRKGSARDALITLGALRRLPAPVSADPRIDVTEAEAQQALGDSQAQQRLSAHGAEVAAARGSRELAAYARTLEGQALRTLGENDKAKAAIEEGRRLYAAAGDQRGTARALNMMATLLHDSGDSNGARLLYGRALAIHRAVGDRRGTATALANLGMVAYFEGNGPEASRLYAEALAAFREIGARYEEASVLKNLGAQAQVAGELARAEQRYREALTIYSELGDKTETAATLTNLGEIYHARGDLQQSLSLHEESLGNNRALGEKSGTAYDLFRIGLVLTDKGDLSLARTKLAEAARLQEQIGEKTAAADTQLATAALDLAEGDAPRAESEAQLAEEVLRVAGFEDPAAQASLLLAEAQLAQGKPDGANKTLESKRDAFARSTDQSVRLRAAIASARVRVASGQAKDIAGGRRALEALVARLAGSGPVGIAFAARLALAEAEIASGMRQKADARLTALAADARARGFGQIASRAEGLVGTHAATR